PATHTHTSHLAVSSVCSLLRLAYASGQKRRLGGKAIEHDVTQPLIVHSTLGYIGGLEELILWPLANVPGYKDPSEDPEYAAAEDELQPLADREFAAYIDNAARADAEAVFAYMDFSSAALEAMASARLTAGGAPSRPGTSAGSAAASRPTTQGAGRVQR